MYQQIIKEVVESSVVTFEEEGVEAAVLMELRDVSQIECGSKSSPPNTVASPLQRASSLLELIMFWMHSKSLLRIVLKSIFFSFFPTGRNHLGFSLGMAGILGIWRGGPLFDSLLLR